MASTQLSLIGRLASELHAQVIARLSTASETGGAYSTTETFFERGSEAVASDENILRLRATRLAGQGDKVLWSMQVLQKPESARISPDILQRSSIEAPVSEGDPFELVSALGFNQKKAVHQRGVRFIRGAVEVLIYQLFETPEAPQPIDPTHYIVTLTTRSANPRAPAPSGSNTAQQGPSAQELKQEATERLKETRSVLLGLVDLKPYL